MKIISLNCWVGKLYDSLVDFIKKHNEKVDVFCFQEVVFGGPDDFFSHHKIHGQVFEKMKLILKNYAVYASPNQRDSYFGEDKYKITNGANIGQAIFVKKEIDSLDPGSFLVYPKDNDPFEKELRGSITGKCQHVDLEGKISLISVHGLWQGGKGDTPERLEQSRRIIDFVERKGKPALVLGDFNLFPDTESVGILSRKFRNLISDHKIDRTRSSFYHDMEKYKDYIADYAFLSPEIKLKDFRVLEDEASDHLPLFMEIDLK